VKTIFHRCKGESIGGNWQLVILCSLFRIDHDCHTKLCVTDVKIKCVWWNFGGRKSVSEMRETWQGCSYDVQAVWSQDVSATGRFGLMSKEYLGLLFFWCSMHTDRPKSLSLAARFSFSQSNIGWMCWHGSTAEVPWVPYTHLCYVSHLREVRFWWCKWYHIAFSDGKVASTYSTMYLCCNCIFLLIFHRWKRL